MDSQIQISQDIDVRVERERRIDELLALNGRFMMEHWRDGKKLAEYDCTNGITDEGKKKILDLYFYYTDTQVPDDSTYAVYIGLINTGATLASTDTYVSHTGWTEYTNYKVSAQDYRGKWSPGAASGAGTVSITNATPITYDIDGAGGTVYGIFICSGTITEIRAQGNTTAGNKLWATGAFAAEIPVVSGDQIKITYTVNC